MRCKMHHGVVGVFLALQLDFHLQQQGGSRAHEPGGGRHAHSAVAERIDAGAPPELRGVYLEGTKEIWKSLRINARCMKV